METPKSAMEETVELEQLSDVGPVWTSRISTAGHQLL